ncbi:hypothetical protein [Streptomyces sp. SAJ15]|uniref:hypothetical protein n=1 Tax=Streptomyces sp. SAJ15 TaxID=2011095 RepID=UPI001185A397|nr:hypothetical protein [Streptomyces sp. SAJ15]TVL94246.1 hypothetical protein CD790_04490 [Streptomyces sp. SAJ15]
MPFVLALTIFAPSRLDRTDDPLITRAHIARTAVGVAATLWMIYAYPMRQSATDFAKDRFTEVFISAGVLVVTGPIALIAFLIAARPPLRSLYLNRVGRPLLAVAAFCAWPVVLWWLLAEGGLEFAKDFGILQFVVYPLSLVAALFVLLFGLGAIVFSVHFTFRAADVHEILPPLLAPVLVWTMFGFQLFDDAPVAAPPAVQLLFLIAPPVSVTALSVWEVRRLRTHHGITLRRALHRDRPRTA